MRIFPETVKIPDSAGSSCQDPWIRSLGSFRLGFVAGPFETSPALLAWPSGGFTPSLANIASKAPVKLASRSRIRNRKEPVLSAERGTEVTKEEEVG